jgi:hypothetical protein
MTAEHDKPETVTDSHEVQLSKSMASALHDFVQNADSLRSSYRSVMKTITATHEQYRTEFRDYVLANGVGHPREDQPDIIEPVSPFPREHWHEYRCRSFALDKAGRAHIAISKSFLVSLISAFDSFMAAVLRFVLLRTPAMLNAKQGMTFERLSSFADIEAARLFVLNQEVDKLLHDSRTKQFKWLEENLTVDLRGDTQLWSSFVEIEQRRHMFVHCGGRVTEDYLSECARNGLQLPKDMVVGDMLLNTEMYFHQACSCAVEVGVRLGQVIWRKLLPYDTKPDEKFINFCYDRIVQEEYDLAIRLLNFAVNGKPFKFKSQQSEFCNRLNLAQAYKWKGDGDACSRELQSMDFSAAMPLFRLARACLEERFDDAVKLVEEIGAKCPNVDSSYYRDWPIFKGLRDRPEFPAVFERVFGSPLLVAEPVDLKPLDDDSTSARHANAHDS